MVTGPTVVPVEPARVTQLREQLIPFAEIQPCLDANYLVQAWLGVGGLSMLYGPSNSGKTFTAIDLAMHVASGTPWRGKKVKRGLVVYVAAEGGAGIHNRISAIRKAKTELADDPDFVLLPTHLDLHGDGDAMALCAALPPGAIALIVIDTLARSFGSGEENSAGDMGRFIANLDAIRARTGAHVLVVHHSGKDQEAGARGSSALKAAVDTEIKVKDGKITCEKQRDMEYPEQLFFDLETVDLGTDAEGDPVTSAVVISTDAPPPKSKSLTGQAGIGMQALRDALREHGQIIGGLEYPPDRECVTLTQWQEACEALGLSKGTSESAPRVAFNRVKKSLLDANDIGIVNGHVWAVSDE